jgi:hypothetical protein
MNHLQLRIYSFRNLTADLTFDKQPYSQAEIINAVKRMLEFISNDLLDLESDFIQTEDKNACKYCDFINICQRN